MRETALLNMALAVKQADPLRPHFLMPKYRSLQLPFGHVMLVSLFICIRLLDRNSVIDFSKPDGAFSWCGAYFLSLGRVNLQGPNPGFIGS